MRLLLTGASGFIGRAMLRRLGAETGWEVHLVSRRSVEPLHPGWTHHAADLLEPGRAAQLAREIKATHLLHLAWNAQPGVFWTALDNLAWSAATLNLYQSFLEAGGARAVFAGTCAEYDWSQPDLVEGKTPLRPSTLYGVAKDAVRRVVEAASTQSGVGWAWGRIFFIYGPEEQTGRLVSDVSDALSQARVAETSGGVQQRNFMHVDDVAGAFLAALKSDYVGAFNVVAGEPVPIRTVVERLAQVAGRPDLLRLGARPSRRGDPLRLAGDGRILREEIGFVPSFDLPGGLEDSYRRRSEAAR